MRLTGEKWANYSTPYIDTHKDDEWYKKNMPEHLELKTCSVKYLAEMAMWMMNNCERNHKDPDEVPVFINFDNKKYIFESFSCGTGKNGMQCEISSDHFNELIYTAPDAKPNTGEYWASRGPGHDDCSGFVVSKKAGERLRRLVRYVLDNDVPKSWLDYRDYEPNWIQFKFSAEEFDVERLDKMSKDAGGIVTEEILRECMLNKKN